MQDFVYQSAPMRVVFGTGTLRQLPDELTRLGVSPRAGAGYRATECRWWPASGR